MALLRQLRIGVYPDFRHQRFIYISYASSKHFDLLLPLALYKPTEACSRYCYIVDI